MTAEVFKLQRPLGGDDSFAAVYNRDRSRQALVPYDAPMREFFFDIGNPPKVYVLADLEGTELVIRGVVEPREW